MKFIREAALAVLLATCAAASVNAQTQNECAVINQIIDSGLDRQYPFAAVYSLTLPNADSCDVEFGEEHSESNTYLCQWNAKNNAELDEMEDEESELFSAYIDHDGGYDYWDEAEELIEDANYWIRTYNAAIRSIPQPNRRQIAKMNEWLEKAEGYERRAHAAEQEAMALDRERDEAEARYDAKKMEVELFERELEKLAERQSGALYTGLYGCFNSGAIRNASTYQVNPQAKQWTSDGGCKIEIRESRGPRLFVRCPNPNYNSG